MTVLPLAADGPLKSKLIALAFEDCGMSDLSITPEDKSVALRKLNAMMTEEPWSNIPYAHPAYNDGGPNEPSGIPSLAQNGVVKHLALILHGVFRIPTTPMFNAAHAKAKLQIDARYAASSLIPSFRSGTPRGAGNRWAINDPFFPVSEA